MRIVGAAAGEGGIIGHGERIGAHRIPSQPLGLARGLEPGPRGWSIGGPLSSKSARRPRTQVSAPCKSTSSDRRDSSHLCSSQWHLGLKVAQFEILSAVPASAFHGRVERKPTICKSAPTIINSRPTNLVPASSRLGETTIDCIARGDSAGVMNSVVNCAPVASTPRIISANPVNIIVACGHRDFRALAISAPRGVCCA